MIEKIIGNLSNMISLASIFIYDDDHIFEIFYLIILSNFINLV